MGPTIKIDGKLYSFGSVEFETVLDQDGVRFISAEANMFVELCSHCHHFKLEHEVLNSVEELVEKGWLIPA